MIRPLLLCNLNFSLFLTALSQYGRQIKINIHRFLHFNMNFVQIKSSDYLSSIKKQLILIGRPTIIFIKIEYWYVSGFNLIHYHFFKGKISRHQSEAKGSKFAVHRMLG